jgi:hypothetical protein
MSIGLQTSYSLIPVSVFNYWANSRNAWGEFGWRRDNWGDDGYDLYLSGNDFLNGSILYSNYFLNKWKTSLVIGEPANDLTGVSRNPPGNGTPYGDLLREVNLYHATSFGNGNYPISASNTSLQSNIRAASFASGYRVGIDSLRMNSTATAGAANNVALYWYNKGIAPVYDNWNVTYQLRDAGNIVRYSQNSNFSLKLFYKVGDSLVSEALNVPITLAPGTYNLYMIITDPNGYMQPFPLNNTGRQTDGSYVLKNNITVIAGGSNQSPIANAGFDTTIISPVSTATLRGNLSSDPDGTISTYAWTRVSGTGGTITSPAAATTTVTGLSVGTYVYQLTVTDNNGAQATDQVVVTVNFIPQAPPPFNVLKAKVERKN